MGDFTRLEIETHRLSRDIETLERQIQAVRNSGDAMMAEIRALSNMWEGPAKDAFTAQFETDYNALQEITHVLDILIEELTVAREQYERCEAEITELVQSIQI